MVETPTLYKLIILFMLSKVDFPLTKSQISEFILGQGYTTFFKLQEALADMESSSLISAERTHNRTLYRLTDSGRDTIRFFAIAIAPEIRSDVSEFLKEHGDELQEDASIKSDYRLTENNEFEVSCLITENEVRLVGLTLTVPTKAEAESIVNNWPVLSQEVYSLLLSKLL